MNKTEIIRVTDLLPSAEEIEKERKSLEGLSPEQIMSEYMPNDGREVLLIKLFGELPDYRDERINAIWTKFMEGGRDMAVAYCLSEGLDIGEHDGKVIKPWCDIATMLKASKLGIVPSK